MSDIIVVGSYVQDLAFSTQSFPSPGETRIGAFRTGQGGKGFNQAVAAHRQKYSTMFIGAIGKDLFGEGVKQFALQEGLRAEFEELDEHPTGAASIVVDKNAANMIVVALGASDYLSANHIRQYKTEFSSARAVLTQAECNLAAVREALCLGREAGSVTLFNPAPINPLIQADDLRMADIITPNETEFIFLVKHIFGEDLDEDFWKLPADQLHKICVRCGVPTVVLTLGENGCFVSHNRAACSTVGTRYTPADQEDFYKVDALNLEPIDTTGAGDGFNGGLAAGLIRTPDNFRESVHFATVVAGLSTLRQGTSPAMPQAEEVQERITALARAA